MKRTFTLICILLFVLKLNAQIDLKEVVPQPYPGTSGHSSPNGTCDTLNLYEANNWSAYYYEYRGGGSVLGVNNLTSTNDSSFEVANAFDASASNYNLMTGGLVYFAFANSNVVANLNKNIVFKLYDNVNNEPGNVLASATVTLGQVHQDVLQGRLTEFKFAAPVALPASRQFFVSVDYSNFVWNFQTHDSIAVVATKDDETTNNTYQYINSNKNGRKWVALNRFWRNSSDSLDVTLYVFPYVTTTPDACSVLPVSIFNFGGYVKNNQAYLNWSTAAESNNKGFYVERSKDAQNFTSIGFVNGAGNTSQITNYTFTDAGVKELNVDKSFYRLKQVDVDGKYTYSNVLSLDLENTAEFSIYPNPVKNTATVKLYLDVATTVQLQIFSRDGKLLVNSDKRMLDAGVQQLYINTQAFAKGAYIIQVTVGNKTYKQTIVKE